MSVNFIIVSQETEKKHHTLTSIPLEQGKVILLLSKKSVYLLFPGTTNSFMQKYHFYFSVLDMIRSLVKKKTLLTVKLEYVRLHNQLTNISYLFQLHNEGRNVREISLGFVLNIKVINFCIFQGLRHRLMWEMNICLSI